MRHLPARLLHTDVDRSEPVGQASPHGLLLDESVTQCRQHRRLVIEVDDVDRDLDVLTGRHRIPVVRTTGQAVPEVLTSEVTLQARERGVQHQPHGVQQVALASAVLPDDDRTRLDHQVDIGKIPEVSDRDAVNTQRLTPCV